MRWMPTAAGVLAAVAGLLSVGPLGLAAGAIGFPLHFLPLRWRVPGVLPVAVLPVPPLGNEVGLACTGLLFAAVVLAGLDTVGRPGREAVAASVMLLALTPVAFALIPRMKSFFEADDGLAAFFLGGVAVLSLGLALGLLPGRDVLDGSGLDEKVQPPVG